MKACLLNFVQDLFEFPWTREEFLRCNSFRESYDVFHDRLGDCSFEEYVEFFKEFNLECSTLEKSIGKLSDEQLEQISGGGIGRFIAIPMVALTLLSGVSSVTGFAASIKAPVAVSAQANVQDEWAKTRSFIARAGDPWLSMLPIKKGGKEEPGFKEYKDPEVDFDKEESKDEKVVLGKVQEDGSRENVYPQIYEIVQSFMDYTNGKKDRSKLPKDLGEIVDAADSDMGNVTQRLPRDLKVAKYIYVWIAKKMKYDNELARSIDVNERAYRAMPGVVFERKDGICSGFAKLARLMMRMAGIPCAYVGSPFDKSAGGSHGFNAIYIKKFNKNGDREKGWTLMDATWGRQNKENAKSDIKDLHAYFPAAYDNKSLKENNTSMMRDMSHQVRDIESDNSYILNGVKYTVNDDSSISVSSENADARLSLQIPESILALKRKIKIESGIRKYKYSGDEEIDISNATNLEEINTDNSKRYKFKDGILRDNYNGKLRILETNGVRYTFKDSYIYVAAAPRNPVSLQIPRGVLDFGLKIVIGYGIKEYIYSDDEEIDISEARDLQSIKTPENGKYKFKDGVLYENDENGNKKAVGILPNIDGFHYSLSDSTVTVSRDFYGVSSALKIPQEILNLKRKIKIGFGVEEYICSGNEEIDIGEAYTLKSVTGSLERYSKLADGILYERVKDKKGNEEDKAVGVLPEIDGFRYSLSDSTITVSSNYRYFQTLKIPKAILGMYKNPKVKIGGGIKRYKYSGNEEIDISEAENLEFIDDMPPEGRYSKFKDGILYEKDKATEKAVGMVPKKIGGISYSLSGSTITVSDPGFLYKASSKTIALPEHIRALKKKTKIGPGIVNYKCVRDEEVDISEATSLQSIDTKESKKYEYRDYILYEKDGTGKEEVVGIMPNIECFHYSLKEDGSIYVAGPKNIRSDFWGKNRKTIPYCLHIPPSILNLKKKIVIGEGISTYMHSDYSGEVDISEAVDLSLISTPELGFCSVEGGILYKHDENGNKRAVGFWPKIDGVTYSIGGDSISVVSDPKKPVDLKIKKEILDMHRGKRIKIGKGIRTYTCSGNEEIDISEAKDLQSITGYSERYSKFENGVLYKVDGRVADLKPGASVRIGEFKYDRRHNGNYITVSAVPGSHAVLKNLALNSRIVIGEGIEQYEYSGNEKIDITQATELKMINTGNSTRYRFADGILYERVREGWENEKEKAIAILPVIDGVYYNLFYDCIYVYDDHNSGDAVLKKIPKAIKALGKTLPKGIKVGTIAKCNFIRYEG